MKKPLISLTALVLLASCAFTVETALQDVSVVTPGAQNARCTMEINGFKYTMMPPETINVTKSDEEMILYCRAPGNRERTVFVPAIASDLFTFGALSTGGVSGIVDYVSNASHYYPDVIEVDFTNVPVRPEPLPQHNASDIRQPENYMLEEFLPGTPRLNSDRYRQQEPVRRRQRSSQRGILSSGYDPSYNNEYESDGEAYLEGEMPSVGFGLDGDQGAVDVLDPSGTQSDVVGDVIQGMRADQASTENSGSVESAPASEASGTDDIGAPPEVSPNEVEVIPTP